LVAHPSISREHARLIVTGERAEIEDRSSKNGTWLRNSRVEGRVTLADGDEVRVGEVRLLYRGRPPVFLRGRRARGEGGSKAGEGCS